jgi:glutamine synthetase
MPGATASLFMAALTESVESGRIDTVLVVFTDMQGWLRAKRVHALYFLDEVAAHGVEGWTWTRGRRWPTSSACSSPGRGCG